MHSSPRSIISGHNHIITSDISGKWKGPMSLSCEATRNPHEIAEKLRFYEHLLDFITLKNKVLVVNNRYFWGFTHVDWFFLFINSGIRNSSRIPFLQPSLCIDWMFTILRVGVRVSLSLWINVTTVKSLLQLFTVLHNHSYCWCGNSKLFSDIFSFLLPIFKFVNEIYFALQGKRDATMLRHYERDRSNFKEK